MAAEAPLIRYPKNLDVKCLRCGAMNIPENKICGRCGASLPLVYDEEGKVFDWKEDPYYQALLKKREQESRQKNDKSQKPPRLVGIGGPVPVAFFEEGLVVGVFLPIEHLPFLVVN